MSNLFNDFPKVTMAEWENKIKSELKGSNDSILHTTDVIEEIDFHSYYQAEEIVNPISDPAKFPFSRGAGGKNNEWKNAALILVNDEREANNKALHKLMTGADLLVFEGQRNDINWQIVFTDIRFEFISVRFNIRSLDEYLIIHAAVSHIEKSNIQFACDYIGDNWKIEDFNKVAEKSIADGTINVIANVNGFGIQQAGATVWQENGFCLNAAHEVFLRLINAGFSTNEAAQSINFSVGIGGNYFYEIAKIRALRQGWAKIVNAYKPNEESDYSTQVTAIIGHSNKSLKDPFTNLLRQTTEAMSAINGGINQLLVLPYDLYADEGNSDLAERMALNIPLILKEESYLDKVIDPVGGSYVLEKLTQEIGDKSWTFFKRLEAAGGLFTEKAGNIVRIEVGAKQQERIQAFISKDKIGIGINKFPDPNQRLGIWKNIPDYFGMRVLIYELEFEKVTV